MVPRKWCSHYKVLDGQIYDDRARFIAKWVVGVAILICSSRRRRGVGFYKTFRFTDKIFDGLLRWKIPKVNLLKNNDVSY